MPSERWYRIGSLFHQALEHPPLEREAFLLAACDDATIRAEVAVLLQEDESSQDFFDGLAARAATLEEAALQPAGAEVLAGRRIGSYRLEREIGRGGTSVVYLASRIDGAFERSVAVKILTPQTDSAALRRRFVREQQVLSDLNHPNIASLFDAGVTEEGRPFFVMEYVDGSPIDRYCDSNRLTVEERLRLFLAVIAAVEYAHKHLVVHRDLKPSNILVAEDGTVKLLDFGVAKILTGDGSAPRGGTTRTGDRWMTPNYAAPEQVRGERTTTATDVYQLGVVLYEILTGHGPYAVDSAAAAYLIERAVCETEPQRPSTVVKPGASPRITPDAAGETRKTDARRLQRRLSGDLDAIVLQALQKEIPHRYGSAEALGRDLERFLNGLPVEARKGKRRYHVGKFLRRHRVPVGALALAAVLLIGISGLYVIEVAGERDRARIEATKAGEVTDFMLSLFEAGHPEEARGELLTAPMLLERGLARAEELADQPVVQAQVLFTIARAYHGLGEIERSEALFERSLAIRRQHLDATHPEVALGLAHIGWSRLVRSDYAGAAGFFRDALGIQRKALGPGDAELANSLNGLGLAINGLGRNEEAIRLLREALEIRRAALGDAHVEIATGLNDLAILLRTSGDAAGAERLVRDGLAMRRGLLDPDHPDIARSTKHLASLLRARGEQAAAEPLLLETLRIQRRALGEQHPYTLSTLRQLIEFYEGQGATATAASFRNGLDAVPAARSAPVHGGFEYPVRAPR